MKYSNLKITVTLMLVSLLVVSCGGGEERKEKYLLKGQKYLQENNVEKAKIEFKNAIQIDPKFAEAHYYMAKINEQLKSYRDALGGYNKAIELRAGYKEAIVGVARVYLVAAANDKAIEFSNKALALSAEYPDALVVRAAANFRKNNVNDALADVQLALSIAPDDVASIALLSRIYLHNKQAEKSESLILSALDRKPGDVSLQIILMQFYNENKNYAMAINVLDTLIDKFPEDLSYRHRKAKLYMQLNEDKKTEEVLRSAVIDFPDNINAKLLLIKYLSDHKNLMLAQLELSRFIKEDNDNPNLKLVSAKLYIKAEDKASAENIYRRVIEKHGYEAVATDARFGLAQLLVLDERTDEGKRILNDILKDNSTHNESLFLRGKLALNERDSQSAIADFRALQKDQPSSVIIVNLLAQSYLQAGELDLAEEAFKQVLALTPANLEVRLTLARLFHQQKNYNDAIEQLTLINRLKPDNLETRQLLFKSYISNQDLQNAGGIANQLKVDHPDISLGYFYSGLVLQAQKKYLQSMVLFEKALDKSPESIEPLSSYVRVALDAGLQKKAEEKLSSMLKKQPEHLVAQNLLGEVFLQQKKYSQAIKVFKRALIINSQWWVPYRNLASAQVLSKQFDKAVETYRKGIKKAVKKDKLSLQLAQLLERQGKIDEVVALYDEMIKTNSNSDIVVNNLALVLIDYYDDERSKDRALSLVSRFQTSRNPNFLDTLGWVHYKRGEYERALSALLQADGLAPSRVIIQYHLASVYYSKGDTDKARQLLEIVSQSANPFRGKKEAKRILSVINNA